MSQALSLIAYNLVLPAALTLAAPSALIKMRRRGGRWSDFAERFGNYGAESVTAVEALPRDGGRYWMHAVSVGEVNIAGKLIDRLLRDDAACGVVLTTTTPTGRQLAGEIAARHAGRVAALYGPLDFVPSVRSALDMIRPTHLALVEAEVWPNLVTQAKRLGIPVSLVNARLSVRSERRFRRLGFLTRPIFGILDQVCVQDETDVARWIRLGAAEDRIHLTGSVKFDPQDTGADPARIESLRSLLERAGIDESRTIVIAASTHPGEERELAAMFGKLKKRIPGAVLLMVPRHVERTAQVLEDVRAAGLSVVLRTEMDGFSRGSSPDCVIVNTTGELRHWQHLAAAVVVGKSFLAEGGQNPAEAIMAGKPVLFGPHMENFASLAASLVEKHGAIQVAGFADLEHKLEELLQNPAMAKEVAQAGHRALMVHAGATGRTSERLRHPIISPAKT